MSTPVARKRHLWGHIITGRVVMTGLWADAALVMAASAYNGGEAFLTLGEAQGQGIALGVAVDVALAVALIGDRALHLEGRYSHWGRAIRIITAGMSLALNCGVPLIEGRLGVAAFHAFLPVLLVLLSEYAQDVTLQFGEIAEDYRTDHAAATPPAPSPAPTPEPTWQPRTVGNQAPPAAVAQPSTAPVTPRFSVVPNMSTTGTATSSIAPNTSAQTVASPSRPGTDDRPATAVQDVPRSVHQDVPAPHRETSQPLVPDRPASPPARRRGDRPAPAPVRRPVPRPVNPSRRAGQQVAEPMTDEQLAGVIRDMAARNGGELPTAYRVKATHPVGHAKASRVLAQLDTHASTEEATP